MNEPTFCVKPDREGDLQIYLSKFNACIARFSPGVSSRTRRDIGALLSREPREGDAKYEDTVTRMAVEEWREKLAVARQGRKALSAFEALADLYYLDAGRLAPGKDDRTRDSGSAENRAIHAGWIRSGLALHRAGERIAELEAALEKREQRIEELEDNE